MRRKKSRVTSRGRRVSVGLTVAALVMSGASAVAGEDRHSMSGLAWISGTWVMKAADSRTEERWTDVGGDMMLGTNRTLAGGRTVFFEFLRIEQRDDGIVYVAQPRGRPGVDFRLTALAEHKATFENPAHDFPKRIQYWLEPDGSLSARADGGPGSEQVQSLHFKPLAD